MTRPGALDNWEPGSRSRRVRDYVATAFGMEPHLLAAGGRRHEVVKIRHLAMWVVKQCCPDMTYPMMGRLFGGRDHSTVIHGLRTHEKRAAGDPEFGALAQSIADSVGIQNDRFVVDEEMRAQIAKFVAAMESQSLPAEPPAPSPRPAPSSTVRLPRNDFSMSAADRPTAPAYIARQEDVQAAVRLGTQALYAAVAREGLSVC